MCGFVAQFNKNTLPVKKQRIKAMADDIHHRGPDDEGFHFGSWFGLGFKRLAILDLTDAGHQPMFDEERRFVIVYNGELYNFKDLRQDLTAKGEVFFSNTDTEVVLKSFKEWGAGCLSRFVGMFAFVIVDLVKDKVFVARDQLGIKPLYLYEDDQTILISSEIKCFRHHIRFELNTNALYEQLFYRYVSGKSTIFKNVYRLPAGSYREFHRNGSCSTNKYYDVTESLLHAGTSHVNLKEIESAIDKSIYSHTQSDVGFNIQLSGGLDSSYITAVLAKKFNQNINTYSVRLEGYKDDESNYQNLVSKIYGTQHHYFNFTGIDLANNLEQATWQMDIPIIHTACVFLMLLCRESGKHSKVILTGEGADEMFCGYGRYNIPKKRKIAFFMKKMGFSLKSAFGFWKFRGLTGLLSKEIGIDEQILFDENERMTLFSEMEKSIDYRRNVAAHFPKLVQKIAASDQTSYLNSLLERQDKMSMAASVEARVPYCLHSLFDLVNRLKPEDKIQPVPKIILKRLAERYFEKDFVYRKKKGFTLPYKDWLRDKKGVGRYLDILTDTKFKQRGFYNTKGVARAIDEYCRGTKDWSWNLMNLINFEIWHRVFIDKKASP